MKDKVVLKCCFHPEKTPSMTLDFKTFKYHCFTCGESGEFSLNLNVTRKDGKSGKAFKAEMNYSYPL